MHDFISLSAYWDDELPKADKADLADHLADCTLCQGWLSSVAVLTRTIALFPHAPMPADFASRLDARLPDPEAEGSLGAALRSLPTYQAKPDFLSRLMAKLPVCPSFADLSAWVDGELASAEAGELSDHLSVCAPCLKRTAQLHALTGAVRTLPIPVAPPLTAVVLGLGSCPSRTDLSAWLDGELAATGVDLTTHLAACGECAQALVQWQYLGRGIQALPIPVATSPIVLCPDPAELVAEGALPVEIAEHVAGCEPCTVRLANWALLGTAMRLLPAATVPAGFASRMAATVVPAWTGWPYTPITTARSASPSGRPYSRISRPAPRARPC
jgi:anti-sigma factor RsiW